MACIEGGERELHKMAREDRASDAMYSLGILYSTGDGVPLDYVQAHKWFNLSAMMGNGAARDWRGELAAEMSQLDIADAQKQARAWIAEGKAAEKQEQETVEEPAIEIIEEEKEIVIA